MAEKRELIEDLNWTTEKISSQVWTVNLGTLATAWSLLIADKLPATVRFTPKDAIWVIVPSLLSLLCEMGQYLAAYRMQHQILNRMESTGEKEFQYSKESFLYKIRFRLFGSKIGLAVIGAVIVLFILIRKFGLGAN
jgi:hypothetical protein